VLCDIDGQRLFVERRDIVSSEIGEQAIERSMLGVRGAQFQDFFPEGFVGPKAGVLAGQPIAKITHDIAPSRNVEEATAYSMGANGSASIFGLVQKYKRNRLGAQFAQFSNIACHSQWSSSHMPAAGSASIDRCLRRQFTGSAMNFAVLTSSEIDTPASNRRPRPS
jgi:hypothetical protein